MRIFSIILLCLLLTGCAGGNVAKIKLGKNAQLQIIINYKKHLLFGL